MTNEEYVALAIKTESEYKAAQERLNNLGIPRLLHAGLGIATEAGEILDQIKKHVYYGRELSAVNLKEEAGDLLWYLAILSDALGLEFEEIMAANIAKLRERYGHKFSNERALERNLDAELKALGAK